MKEVATFVAALFRHWKALLTSGVLAVALVVLPAWNVAVPKGVIQAAIVFCIVAAAFGAWKDEQRRLGRVAEELAEAKNEIQRLTTETEDDAVFEVSDVEYWVLLAAAKYGLRRDFVQDRYGATAGLFFLGETPIDYRESRWFYSTVQALMRRGAIKSENDRLHRVTEEGKGAIRAGTRRGRRKEQPEPLIDGRSGAIVTLSL